MKKMIIIIAVLLMLTGGVISVMKTMEIGPFASETTDAEAQDAREGEDGDASDPKNRGTSVHRYGASDHTDLR